MKKLFSDKRWNDNPKAQVIGKSSLSLEELKKKAEKMKKEIEEQKQNKSKDAK